MKKVEINNKRYDIKYRTNSEMRTKATFNNELFNKGLSCDVYSVIDSDYTVLVLNSSARDILESTTVITNDEYDEILELHDYYHAGRYHTALLERCGAVNHLELL